MGWGMTVLAWLGPCRGRLGSLGDWDALRAVEPLRAIRHNGLTLGMSPGPVGATVEHGSRPVAGQLDGCAVGHEISLTSTVISPFWRFTPASFGAALAHAGQDGA